MYACILQLCKYTFTLYVDITVCYYTDHEIRTEDMFAQDKICFDIFSDISIVFDSGICQIKLGLIQVNLKSAWKMSNVQMLFYAV